MTNTDITISAMNSAWYTFNVPVDATNAYVDGHFSAAGGSGDGIEILILKEDQFANWKSGHPAETYYNSRKVPQSSIYAAFPQGGTYYLVINNNFSSSSSKAVLATTALHFSH